MAFSILLFPILKKMLSKIVFERYNSSNATEFHDYIFYVKLDVKRKNYDDESCLLLYFADLAEYSIAYLARSCIS